MWGTRSLCVVRMPCKIAFRLKGESMLKFRLIATLMLTSAILLSACGGGEPSPTPTLSPDEIKTQAVGTFSADLTQTALAAPTNTPLPTLTASATFAPFTASQSTLPANSAPTTSNGATTTSCYALTFASDVTIPDNTQMTAGKPLPKHGKCSTRVHVPGTRDSNLR